MEAHIEALDNQLKETDTIKKLQAADVEILDDLEGLRQGQKDLNEKVETGFEKGKKRMDGIEDKVDKIEKMLIESDKKRDEQHAQILNKITDNEITRLQKSLDERDRQIEKKDGRTWEVAKILFTAIVSVVITAYLVSTGLK